MADATNKRLNIYIDQASAELALETLQKKADKLTASIDKGKASGKSMTAELKKLSEVESSIKGVQQQIDNGLAPSIRQQTTLVTRLRNELRNFTGSEADLRRLSAEYQRQERALRNLEQQTLGVGRAQRAMTNESSLFGRIGLAGGVAMGNLYTKAGEIAIGAVTRLVSVNAQFEKSVANLSAITGATGKDLEFLKNATIDLSATTTRSAIDYVEAMKLIASAKPELLANKEALVEVTKAASLLADASGMELPDASKRLTDALNQFGAPASQAAKYVDALAAAAKYGAAEVPDVTDALLQFGSQAKSSNISIYESAAAIEVLAEKGIKGAEAGTKLRNVFLAMNAVDGLDKKALDSLEKAGVNTAILSDKSLSLETRLKELGKISGDATALVNVFGKENFNAGQIILQNIPRFAELAKQTKEIGVANQQATVNTDTLTAAWDRLGNKAEAAFLKEGGGFTGFLKNIVNWASKAIEYLNVMPRVMSAVQRLDFSFIGGTKRELAKQQENANTNTQVNTIIDVYTEQQKGATDAAQKVLKKLRENADIEYKKWKEARLSGDKEEAARAFSQYLVLSKAWNKQLQDLKTVSKATDVTSDNGDVKRKGDIGIDKKELNLRLAALREEVKKNLTTTANLEAVTYSQPIKPELTIQNPDKVLEDGMNLVDKILSEQATRNKKAGLVLDVMKFGITSKKGVDAQKKINAEDEETEIQEAKRKAALNGTELTENEIAVIREKWRKINQDLELTATQKLISDISNYAQQAIAILDQLSQAQTNRENAQFENEKKNNSKRKKDIQELQKNKVITDIEARKRIADVDREEEKKREELDKKQRERQKKIAIAQAIVNGALAVTSILAAPTIDPTGILKAIQIAAAVATTAAQIAVISSQKFAKGGIANGASHSEGGIKLFDTRSKQVVGEMEGDEPYMILSKNFRRNNPDFIAAALDSSMNRDGARITLPQWQSRQYRPVDYSGISQSATKLRFATGGVVGGANAAPNDNDEMINRLANLIELNTEVMAAHAAATQQLNSQLAKGIRGDWRLNELDDAITDKNNILSEANP